MSLIGLQFSKGINKDIPAHVAPFDRWSDGQNVRFEDLGVVKGSGYTTQRSASVMPRFLIEGRGPTQSFHVYGDLAKMYAFMGDDHAEITRSASDYNGTSVNHWTGGMLNGLLFLNNGADTPQVWNPVSLAQLLVDYSAWPANTYTKCLRPFKNFLVALNVTKSGTDYPRMVKWSHSADPGAQPSSWDETDASLDTGETSLAEGHDILIDCLPLGNVNVIYGENSTYIMRFVGAPFIFSFESLFRNSGIMSLNCVQAFKQYHFAVTLDDIIVHNGNSLESVVDNQIKRWFLANINSSQYLMTRTVTYHKNREIWVLFPYQTATVLNMALVWNWADNTWTVREIPNCYSAAAVPFEVSSAGTSWDALSGTWDAGGVGSDWGAGLTSGDFLGSFLLGDISANEIHLYDNSGQDDGVSFTSYVERKGLDISVAFDGQKFHDPISLRLGLAIWPEIEGTVGTVFKIYWGYHDTPKGPVTWNSPTTWVLGTDGAKVDQYVTGRYLAIKIAHEGSEADWRLNGITVDVVKLGGL